MSKQSETIIFIPIEKLTSKRMEETIYGLLEGWRNNQSRGKK